MSKKEIKNQFEISLKKLEEIVEKLESGDVSLEETILLYEEGVEIGQKCIEKLTNAEIKLQKISKKISDLNSNNEIDTEENEL